MMIRRILIVSDSHGRSQNIKRAIDKEFPDMLIHLGDLEDDPEAIRGWLDDAARTWNSLDQEAGMKLRPQDQEATDYKISLPVPAVFIQGNCDRYYSGNGANDLRQTAVFELNDHRFFCTHGHRQGVSLGLENLMYTAMENDCDIALYGHTHVPFDDIFEGYEVTDSVRILNPGSISVPRGGSSKGYMVMTFDDSGDYTVELKKLR